MNIEVSATAGALEVKRVGGSAITPAMSTGIVVALLNAVIGLSIEAGFLVWTTPSLGEAVSQQQEPGSSAGTNASDATLIKATCR